MSIDNLKSELSVIDVRLDEHGRVDMSGMTLTELVMGGTASVPPPPSNNVGCTNKKDCSTSMNSEICSNGSCLSDF